MKKKMKETKAETHPDLKGLDIRVNEFGEIISNIPVDKLNDFLDKHVVDKKLNEDEWEEKKKKSSTHRSSQASKRKR